MKRDVYKKKGLTVLILLLFAISGFSQKEPDFKDEMIESGERHEIPEEFKTSAGDYDSFLKSKLLNSPASGNTIFFAPRELGISSIGGRVRAALVDKTNQINLVAPSGGGLWKFNSTTNDEFTPINDFGSFMAITDIAQNPFDFKHILIGTGDGLHGIPGNGLFESKDGGNTFAKMMSIDNKSNPDFNYIRFVKFSPYDSKTIYFATNYKIFKSINLGVNWNEVFNSGYSNIHSLDFLAGESVIVGVDDKGIFTSSNGNQGSFKLVTKDLPNDVTAANNGQIDGVVAASHAANRKIAYAFITGTSNDVYKTTDNGVSWNLLTKPDFYIGMTTFCLTIGVHPVNPDIIILGSILWVYTTDGGSSWKGGYGLEVDFHSVHFHDSDPNVAYLGYDQGLGMVDFNKYIDLRVWNGSQYVWEKQPGQTEIGKNEGFNTSQIYYGDYFPEEYGDSYLQGQQDGGCFGKVNNSDARIVVGDGGSVFINKQNPLKAFASTQMGNLSSTSSAIPAGHNYSGIGSFNNNHPNWITQFAGNNSDGNQLYISDNKSIQRTLDGGVSFNPVATHSLNSVKIVVQDSVNPWVYAVGNNQANGKFDLITIKQAATNPITTTINNILSDNYFDVPDHIEIDPNDENSVFITSSAGNAFKISNINSGILSRKSLKGDIENVVINTVIGVKNKSEILIAGTNIGLFYSTNSGVNWILSKELPYTQITDLKLRESDNRLFVFTHGRGTWAVTVNTENTDPKLVHNISGSTNPANAGSIEGTGLINNNLTATLSATPASGFRFVNWTVGDTVVSISANYSFTTIKSRALVANFELFPVFVNSVAGNLAKTLTVNQLASWTKISITGNIDARDFKTLRDSMPMLTELDLSKATIVEYAGSEGTYNSNITYPANTIPVFAFQVNELGLTNLTSVVLPESITSIGQFAFANCRGLSSVTMPSSVTSISNQAFQWCTSLTSLVVKNPIPIDLNSSFDVFGGVNKTKCKLLVPYNSASHYAIANKWKDFRNIIEPKAGFTLSSATANIESAEGSNTTLEITANVGWIASVDQSWLKVNPNSDTGNHLISFTAAANPLIVPRTAFVTFTSSGIASQKIKVIQAGSKAYFTAKAGGLFTTLTTEELKGISKLKLTGTIDARDFKTMRDKMPMLAELDLSGATIVEYTGTEGTAGTGITTYPANEIPSNAFWNFNGGNSFGKVSLNTLILPPALTSFGNYALTRCSNLSTISEFPSTLNSTGWSTFKGVMAPINVNSNNLNYSSIDGVLFNKAQTTLIYCPTSKIGIYSIPSSVTFIESHAFYNCKDLTSVTIPASVTWTGGNVFENCSGLEEVKIYPTIFTPNILQAHTFNGCISLKTINIFMRIPPEVSPIIDDAGNGVFGHIDKTQCKLIVPFGSKKLYSEANIWKEFTNIVEMPGFQLSDYSKTIDAAQGSQASVDLTSDVAWTLGVDQSWLSSNSTSGSGNQTLIFIAEKNPSIAKRTANITVSASGIESQTITITQRAGTNIPLNITAGNLSSTLTVEELSNTTKLTLTGNIDARDFKTMRDKMPLLTELDLSGATIVAYTGTEGTSHSGNTYYKANTIPEDALFRTRLNSILLPDSVTAVDLGAFYMCEKITSIKIPSSVLTIGDRAFGDPYNLTLFTSLYVGWLNPQNEVRCSNEAFRYIDKNKCKLFVPFGTSSFYAKADVWKDFSNIVEMPGFSIPIDKLTVGAYEGSTVSLELSANTKWTVNSNQSWLALNTIQGTGNNTLVFTAQANPLKISRSATVTISSNGLESKTITITQETINKAPIANAGTDQSVNEGSTLSLDGTLSSDPEGNTLTYNWTAPAGITLSSTIAAKPIFITPEVKGDSILSFHLTVNNGFVNSVPDTVEIKVLNVIKVGNSETPSPAFKVYPNPTTGLLTLEFTQNSAKKTVVSVSNLIGAEVFKKELYVAARLQLDLSNQVSGIYLLKVIVDNRQYISKIVVSKKE